MPSDPAHRGRQIAGQCPKEFELIALGTVFVPHDLCFRRESAAFLARIRA